jgi:hypothetical protein
MGIQDMVNEIMDDEITRKGFLKENPLNTPHPQADILRAIADGKEIQVQDSLDSAQNWVDVSGDMAIFRLTDSRFYVRIKPESKTGWINIYSTSQTELGKVAVLGDLCISKEIADKTAAGHREACIQINYIPGEGL